MGEIRELFVLALSLVWFAGATPELSLAHANCYAAPIGAFFCPEIRAFTGVGARFLQPSPKSLETVNQGKTKGQQLKGKIVS